ncbi:DUF1640 domain-containing protein [Arsenophonus sp. ENCA]|uniref:DUF1640 domain-containing protein n=1 Tax=Arsenophonus sp. ENCA TaxID=1987579 RepID=UPI000BC83A78|nr:DUF1640 domain-containing protein [Arsenophonus sp. ENCA]PAV09054.1 DUF1640 domain-containing protein [Arsenophonus sp. ENCA]
MGQVAFDTQEFVEKLENSGLNREQAKAITLVVRKSHEVADLATKRDLEDVRKDLSAEIADVRKEMTHQIADIRKDISMISKDLLFKLGGLMVTLFGLTIAAMKFL